MSIYIHQSHLRINLVLCLSLASCHAEPRPTVSRVWPELGAMMSAAAWSADTARVARALAAAHDLVDRIDSLLQRRRPARIAPLDSTRRDILRRTGVTVIADSFAAGYALDRAALVLVPVVDSALLALGAQYLWIGPVTRRTVGIPDPANSLRMLAAVELRSGSISTSARPPRSVTVLAADGLTAAAWSAAFVALSCDSVLAVGREMSVVCADSSQVRWTTSLQNRVSLPAGRVP
jgi:hypothetical protein